MKKLLLHLYCKLLLHLRYRNEVSEPMVLLTASKLTNAFLDTGNS